MTSIADAYDRAAQHVASGTDVPSLSTAIRHVTAFVKAALLDAAIMADSTPPHFTLVDCACGRGQDVPKLFHTLRALAGVKVCSHLCCMDVSPASLDMARDMVARLFAKAAEEPQVHVRLGDVTADALLPAELGAHPANVITCHLALHYWCDTKQHVQQFFSNAALAAHPSAVLLVTFADGRWVVRAARDAMSQGRVDAHAQAVVQAGPMQLKVPVAHLGRRLVHPFGRAYSYRLQGRLEECTEFLVHEGALARAAASAGWTHVALSERVDVLASTLMAHGAYFASLAALMKASEDASKPAACTAMFRAMVFARSSAVAAGFAAQVWSRR
jgi:hypothetical protein